MPTDSPPPQLPPPPDGSVDIDLDDDETTLEELDPALLVRVDEGERGWAFWRDRWRRELEMETDPLRRAVLAHELGELAEFSAHDETEAIGWYQRAAQEAPELAPNRWSLRRLLRRKGDFAELIAKFDRELAVASSPLERADLGMAKGELWQDRLGDRAAAEKSFAAARQENPRALRALMALERLGHRDPELLRDLLAATPDLARRAALLAEWARLAAELDPDQALLLLRDALEFAPEPLALLDEMVRIAAAAGKVEALDQALEQRIGILEATSASPIEVAALRRQQAMAWRRRDSVRAGALFEQALSKVPPGSEGEQLILADLCQLAGELGRFVAQAELLGRRAARAAPEVAERLEKERAEALRRAGLENSTEGPYDWDLHVARERRALVAGDLASLATLWRREAAEARAAGDLVWEASACATLGDALERHEDLEGAILAHRQALGVIAGFAPSSHALDRLLERTGRWGERDALLSEKLGRSPWAERTRLAEELLDLRRDRLGDLEGAIALAEALCLGNPRDLGRRALLVELHREAQHWASAVAQLGRLASEARAQGDSERAIEAELERADLWERRLGQIDEARTVLREIVAAHPTHVHAAWELERLLRCSGSEGDLAKLLEQKLEGAPATSKLRLHSELAWLYRERLGQPAAAIAHYEKMLELEPHHPVARTALVRLLADDAPERWIALLEQWAAASSDGVGRGVQLLELGELHELAGRFDAAEQAVVRAIPCLDGTPLAAQARFAEWRLQVRRGAATTLRPVEEMLDPTSFSTIVARARGATDPHTLGELLTDLAQQTRGGAAGRLWLRVALHRARWGGEAQEAIRASWSHWQGPPAVVLASEFLGDPEALAERARWAEAAGQATEAIEWRRRQIEALAAAGQGRAAVAELVRMLGMAPRHRELIDLGRRLAQASGDAPAYASATAALAAVTDDPSRSAALWCEAAEQFEALGEREQALVAWRTAFQSMPSERAFERARELLTEAGDRTALDELLATRLAQCEEPALGAVLRIERGENALTCGRRRAALEEFREAAKLGSLEGRAQFARLLGELGALPEAIAALQGTLDEMSHPKRRAELLRDLVRLCQRAGETPQLLAALEELLGAEPTLELDDLGLGQQYVPRVAELLRGQAAQGELSVRTACELRIADLCQGQDDHRGALEALERALEGDPLHREALGRLVAMAEGHGKLALRERVLARAVSAARSAIRQRLERREAIDAVLIETLAEVQGWLGEEEAHRVAAQAAALLNQRPAPCAVSSGETLRELSVEQWEPITPGVAGVGNAIWREIADLAAAWFGPTLASFGLRKEERLNSHGIPLAWVPVAKLGRWLNVVEFQLYRHPRPEFAAVVGDALVLGSAYAERLSPRARFHIAYHFVLLRERLAPVAVAKFDDLAAFVASCAQAAGLRWTPQVALPPLGERTKQLRKQIDRKRKQALGALGPRWAELDLDAWQRAVRLGAARMGLLVSGDLEAAWQAIGVGAESSEAAELVAFAISEEFGTLRRELGMRER